MSSRMCFGARSDQLSCTMRMSASPRDRTRSPASPDADASDPAPPEDLGKCPLLASNCDLATLGRTESQCQYNCEDVT